MSNFEENSVFRVQFLFEFLIFLVNAILSKINIISKSFNEKIDKLQKTQSTQLTAINRLKSENELLKLKESKMKLAIENLLARTAMERDQIGDLKEDIEEMEKIDKDNESEIENLEKNIADKDREIFKIQLKIDQITTSMIRGILLYLSILTFSDHYSNKTRQQVSLLCRN